MSDSCEPTPAAALARVDQAVSQEPLFYTLRSVFSSKRTTVCRIFSCQRSAAALRLQLDELAIVPRHPSISLFSPPSLPPWRAAPKLAAPGVRCKAAWPLREGMVENTGLEPVTSWLQTRRSPS